MTSTVFRTPFSIGYVEQAYSQGLVLPFAAIRNQAGNYVLPSTQTIAAAAAQKPDITPTDFSIVNQPGASSYPISGYSWALIYTHQPSQATGQDLVTMLDWLTHNGQAYAAANLYVPLPAQVRQLAHTMLSQVTGPGGTAPPRLTAVRSRAAWTAVIATGPGMRTEGAGGRGQSRLPAVCDECGRWGRRTSPVIQLTSSARRSRPPAGTAQADCWPGQEFH